MGTIQNPYDVFFKYVMGNLERAKDFFQNNLPKEISDKADWNSLEITNDSFVDENLKESFSDL